MSDSGAGDAACDTHPSSQALYKHLHHHASLLHSTRQLPASHTGYERKRRGPPAGASEKTEQARCIRTDMRN